MKNEIETTVLGYQRKEGLVFTTNKISILPYVELKKNVFLLQRPIVFIHTTKTGGSNIDYLMKAISKLTGYNVIGAYDYCEDNKYGGIMPRGCAGGLNSLKNNMEAADLSNKPKTQFILGHMSLPQYNYFKIDINYISIVRDPVDRLLSLGNFLYQKNYIQESEIEDFILNHENDNLQTRVLAGEAYMDGECTEDIYKIAIDNINKKFAMVTPNEDINVAMSIIAKNYGIENFGYTRVQITGIKIVTKDDQELCDQIAKNNQYDIRLHEYVKEHWKIWKEEYIESISANIADYKEYIVMTSAFYENQILSLANMEQIHDFEQANPNELVGITQNF